jgi:OmcA/MtrC family decaheme c-type cytochrome
MVTAMMAGAYSDGTTSVPGIPAMMAATNNTPDGKANVARRAIIDKAKCETCHDRLGTVPNFHGGSYSIAMCAACHTPIQGGNTGWSASFRVWVHGSHGAEIRTVPFTWHRASDFKADEIRFPGKLNNCDTCHLPGTYDFSASQYTKTDAVGKTIVDYMPNVTAATNNRGNPITLPSDVPPQYPKVQADGSVDYTDILSSGILAYGLVDGANYGSALGINTASGVIVTSATSGNNLVTSPVTAVCSTCHDSLKAIDHMKVVGYGSFYRNRDQANLAPKEQCLSCHSSGVVAIATVHK